MEDYGPQARERLLDKALSHVPFDGWTEPAFHAAAREADMTPEEARLACPRGALDLAVAFHHRGDVRMEKALAEADLQAMRVRDRVTFAVRKRIEAAEDREVVRRGTALFALPHHAAEGAALIWGTADRIWRALGDTSDDINWYTKRATLAGVYGSTVLFWLGDTSDGAERTWAFLDRRIDDVMRIEKMKAQIRESPVLSTLFAGPNWVLSRVKAPRRHPSEMPGSWNR